MKNESASTEQTSEPPKSWSERVFNSTPVAMTLVATLLAGLSTSEMTRAQYDRSMASQLQSKAGDQWSFFQAKRLRGALQQNTVDSLALNDNSAQVTGEALAQALREHAGKGGVNPAFANAITLLAMGRLPTLPVPIFDAPLQAALAAVSGQHPEPEVAALLLQVTDLDLANAVQKAKDASGHFDEAFQPVIQLIDSFEHPLSATGLDAGHPGPSGGRSSQPVTGDLRRAFTEARMGFTVRRYEAEARLNQTLANLYELQVRKSNLSADRHYLRSQRFFFGMLFAQFSVLMSTFAIAVRMKNTLWTLAAIAGLFAVAFAVYVYLYV
jgi:hypothetical protein